MASLRRSAVVDLVLCMLCAGMVVTVLLGNADLFVLGAAALPFAVILVCSLDPPDPSTWASPLSPDDDQCRPPGDGFPPSP